MRITSFFHQIGSRLFAVILCLGLVYAACDNFTEDSYTAADIRYFGFDSFPDFEDYTFYIDNFQNVIYNEDSFPFMSDVDSIYPCITVVSTNDELYINDSLWKVNQIRDFSSSPMTLRNTSEDGKYTKTYQLHINIHQVDPDSMVMNIYSQNYPNIAQKQKVIATANGYTAFLQLKDGSPFAYSSTDGKEWTSTSLTGLPKIFARTLSTYRQNYYIVGQDGSMYTSKDLGDWTAATDTTPVITLFGTLNGRKYLSDSVLIGVVTDTLGNQRFAKYDSVWTMGDILPEDFPIEDYAVTNSKTVTEVPFYIITTGLNADGAFSQSTYSTMDGLYWATIKSETDVITPRQGASIFYYNDALFLYGGENQKGDLDPDLYISTNHGLSWETAESKLQFKNIEKGLSYQQILIEDKYIRIFGGNSDDETQNVWEGYMNKMLF